MDDKVNELDEILSTSFIELGFNSTFCELSERMGYRTLKDVCSISPAELINKKEFTYTWLGQLADYMDKKGILHLLQNPFKSS
ncbi:hypothetical protein [Pedobacter miscanthi]|uniref:hypothetical protein n=1 Tax=Pedobacter miscanthi TaxID=2259170 RepID=UPI0029312DF3|nr:hypothetical protein [Pedobacter miscanthi]